MPDDESPPPDGPPSPSGPANPYGGPSPFGQPGGYGQSPYGPPPRYGQPNPYGGPSPYGPQHGVGYQPPASKAMAGWALGLTLFVCVPIVTALVGIVLAIVSLRRGRDGRDHGKGLAIGALVIGPLVVLVWVGLLGLFALGSAVDTDTATRDSDGEVVDGGEVATNELQVGDCFDDPAMDDPEATETLTFSVEVVPCDEPHRLEVYFESEFASGGYLGEDRTGDLALNRCIDEFREFIGRGYARSEIEVYTYYPLERSWKLLDDRKFTCMVADLAGPVTGTLRNARR